MRDSELMLVGNQLSHAGSIRNVCEHGLNGYYNAHLQLTLKALGGGDVECRLNVELGLNVECRLNLELGKNRIFLKFASWVT